MIIPEKDTLQSSKGQLISKAKCQAEDSSKKRTNEFVFTSMWHVFVRFLGESSARKKTFRDYLTFTFESSFFISNFVWQSMSIHFIVLGIHNFVCHQPCATIGKQAKLLTIWCHVTRHVCDICMQRTGCPIKYWTFWFIVKLIHQ